MPSAHELDRVTSKQIHAKPVGFYPCEGGKVPFLIEHSVAALAKDILAHNTNNPNTNYTSIVMTGKSGSGKTTVMRTLCHRIACMNKLNMRYSISYFRDFGLAKLDTIIDNLSGGNHIIIFDDVSFIFDELGTKDKKRLARKLTTIRHDVKGNVITMMGIHYQKALGPMLRDADFRILTSMSDQDRSNWMKTMGRNSSYKLSRFQKQYAYQTKRKVFYINNLNGRDQKYNAGRPFRLNLVSDVESLHELLVPEEGCKNCALQEKNTEMLGSVPAHVLRDEMAIHYKHQTDSILREWLFFVKGMKKVFPPAKRSAFNFIFNFTKKHPVNPEEMAQLLMAKKQSLGGVPNVEVQAEKNILDKSNLA